MEKIYLRILFTLFISLVSFTVSAFTIDTVSVAHPSCDMAHDGSITLSQSGGVGTVMYYLNGINPQSSPVFTGLEASQYQIFAEDAVGNIATIVVDLPMGPGLELNLITTPTVCYGGLGGTLTINPVNEVAPYSVTVSGGTIFGSTFTSNTLAPIVLNNLENGLYQIDVVDARGCINTITGGILATVPSGDSLHPATTIISPSCTGSGNGYISFDFNVGNGPYDINLNDGVFTIFALQILSNQQVGPVNPGTYDVLMQDNIMGCWGQMTFVIPDGLAASTQITPPAASICSTGNSVNLSGAASLPGAQFSWSPSAGLSNASIANPVATPVVTTTYTLTTTDGNNLCASSATVTINVENIETPLVSLNTGVLSVTNLQTGATYTWQQLNGSSWDDVGTGTTYNATTGNEYRVRSGIGSCEAYSGSTIARSSSTYPFAIGMYPNPASDVLRLTDLKITDQWQSLEIVSFQGQRSLPVKDIRNQTSVSVAIAALSSGIYIAKLTKGDGRTVELRFIKQ